MKEIAKQLDYLRRREHPIGGKRRICYNAFMYLEFFGLKARPFSITSDPEFLYMSKKHREAFDALLYGITQRSGFIEISGEIGSGKTTLCRALLTRLPPEVKTAYIFNSNLTESQFLQTFMADLGLPTGKKTRHALYAELNDFLIQQLTLGHNVVLIIDEAQNLTVRLLEQIRMLSNLETDKEKLLQIVLAGQPELRQKLLLPELKQLRQRIAIRYHIRPLDEEEIRAYITHRLSVAGSALPEDVFSAAAVRMICAYSGGIPRLINMVSDKVLLAGFVKKTKLISAELVEMAVQELEGVTV